tara:strand:- start:6570 stop:6848 length:279 start_codon:yes stop_codon:yes gene_type:complete
MINPDEYDENDEKWILVQQLLLNFMAEYTNNSLENLQNKFEKWVNSKTEEELAFYFSDEAAVKKTYKDIETGEIFHTKEDILKSMFEDEDEE